MKIYKSSDLTHKRAEVMREAEKNGVVIQELRTNGEVVKEFVLLERESYIDKIMSDVLDVEDQDFIAFSTKPKYKPLDFN